MRLRNKKTGEIYETTMPIVFNIKTNGGGEHTVSRESIAELNEEWEDAPEEPFSTSFYTIVDGKIKHCIFYRERVAGCPDDAWAYLKDDGKERIKQLKEVGLYFETEEEAEKAVEKLKAWKRLKDKGFRFAGYTNDSGDLFSSQVIRCRFDDFRNESRKDLDLLFGGEE